MTTPMTGRLGGACAAAAVLALAACGGGTDTASPDTQSAATDSGAQAHDASTQTFGFLRRIEKFTINTDAAGNGALQELESRQLQGMLAHRDGFFPFERAGAGHCQL